MNEIYIKSYDSFFCFVIYSSSIFLEKDIKKIDISLFNFFFQCTLCFFLYKMNKKFNDCIYIVQAYNKKGFL